MMKISTSTVGVSIDSAISLRDTFNNNDNKPAVTEGDQVFMVAQACKRNRIQFGTDNRDIDTSHRLLFMNSFMWLVSTTPSSRV